MIRRGVRGFREQIALTVGDPKSANHVELRLGFDEFGDHLRAELRTHLHRVAYERLFFRIVLDAANKATIDFYDMRLQIHYALFVRMTRTVGVHH